jgi:putative ABC transport system ATP-binding protein
MIKTTEIGKTFNNGAVETVALRDVTLEVERGDFIAIMGPSGCGKTTLLNIIGTIDTPSSGNYFFLGQDMLSIKEKQRAEIRKQNIGFVFQNFNLIDELSVYENIELPLIYLKWKRKEREKRINEVIKQLNISSRKDLFPTELSGGQQQRVAVARAIIAKPQLLLADEPTGNLDSMHGEEVMQLLNDLNKNGTTIVMVTHSQRDASYSRRIIHLFDGQIINENINAMK